MDTGWTGGNETGIDWTAGGNQTYTATLDGAGSGDNYWQKTLTGLEAKGGKIGAADVIVGDLRVPFVRDFCFPALRAGAVYEGRYLLGTSLARPLIEEVTRQVARRGAQALLRVHFGGPPFASRTWLREAPIDVLAHPAGMYQRRYGRYPDKLFRRMLEASIERGIAVEINGEFELHQ